MIDAVRSNYIFRVKNNVIRTDLLKYLLCDSNRRSLILYYHKRHTLAVEHHTVAPPFFAVCRQFYLVSHQCGRVSLMFYKVVRELLAHPFFGCKRYKTVAKEVENYALPFAFAYFILARGKFNANICYFCNNLGASYACAKLRIIMKTREDIVGNWLVRYTHKPLDYFTKYILLTNFNNYIDLFCEQCGVEPVDYQACMRTAKADGITIINFGMGSPNAALVMDLLSAVNPTACLFLGKCGSISSKAKVGSYILPLAGIRGEGTSNDYFPPEIPALPAFLLQQAVSTTLGNAHQDYWAGTVLPPTDAFGNMTCISKIICSLRAQWLWTWKRPRCLAVVFITIFPWGHCFS